MSAAEKPENVVRMSASARQSADGTSAPHSGQPGKADVRGRTRRFRFVLLFFIAALVASGLTAIPLRWEVSLLASWSGIDPQADPATLTGWSHWIAKVREGLEVSYGTYPFLACGTDWVAFAHVVIAIFFLGPLFKPGSNEWVLITGMIACVLVIPTAFAMGAARGVPMGWRLIDSSFGFFGFFPLFYCWVLGRRIRLSRAATQSEKDP
jgi:hypothetical protein